MLKEFIDDWKKLSAIEKVLVSLILPFSLAIALAYGLLLLLWNRYGVVFICFLILTEINKDSSNEENIQAAQGIATLIWLVAIIRRSIKK